MTSTFWKISIWAMLAACPWIAAGQRVSWTQYTTNQGLLANVTYEVIQSRDGHVWIATENGLCRFNGYDFITPTDTSMWRGAEAFKPVEDAQGRIWFCRIDGSLWYVFRDTVHPFPYQDRIAPFQRQYELPLDIQCDTDGSLWLAYNALGFVHIYADGSFQVVQGSKHKALAYAEIGRRILAPVVTDRAASEPSQLPLALAVCRDHRLEYLSIFPIRKWVHHTHRGFWRLRTGEILHAYNGTYYLLRADTVVWQVYLGFHARRLAETKEGALLLSVHLSPNPGLYYFASLTDLKRGKGRNLLPGYYVTDVIIDTSGGWWATTHHAGVFYCKNPGVEIFNTDHGLPSDEVSCLASDGSSWLFAGFRPAALAAIHLENFSMAPIPSPPLESRDVEVLFFEPLRQRLWCSVPLHYQGAKGVWQSARLHAHLGGVGAKSISAGLRSGRLWCASSQGFFEVDPEDGWAHYRHQTHENRPYTRTFDVVEDMDGRVWVITREGLRVWKHGQYMPPPFDHIALKAQPRQVCFMPGGHMAIGLRSGGVLIRRADGRMTHLQQPDGLAGETTMRLRVGASGALYICSNGGLSRVVLLPDGGVSVHRLTVREGLPAQQVSDVIEAGGYLWIATHKGLVRILLHQMPRPSPLPAPLLERLLVNNRPLLIQPDMTFPHDSNTLLLRFYSLHYPSEGNIRYRYRLLGAPDTSFTETTQREVLLANLAPGYYTFEVQAHSGAREWSAPTLWVFRIRSAWWQTAWFWMSLGFALAFTIALGYRWRLRQARQQAAVREKIRQLELAALRAQMNPHFIFNCLNSIQHFIVENDAAAARHYLSCFARLVRLALHSAVDGRHTLHEEIEMLHNYLALEQLRFQERFDFRIAVTPEADVEDILLPPLLVQPFVENALLHGLQNKTSGGFVEVYFALDGDILVATITDNGPGLSSTDTLHRSHKSVGMMLTQRRLEMLSDKAQSGAQWENLKNSDGSIAGLRVTLLIPLGEDTKN